MNKKVPFQQPLFSNQYSQMKQSKSLEQIEISCMIPNSYMAKKIKHILEKSPIKKEKQTKFKKQQELNQKCKGPIKIGINSSQTHMKKLKFKEILAQQSFKKKEKQKINKNCNVNQEGEPQNTSFRRKHEIFRECTQSIPRQKKLPIYSKTQYRFKSFERQNPKQENFRHTIGFSNNMNKTCFKKQKSMQSENSRLKTVFEMAVEKAQKSKKSLILRTEPSVQSLTWLRIMNGNGAKANKTVCSKLKMPTEQIIECADPKKLITNRFEVKPNQKNSKQASPERTCRKSVSNIELKPAIDKSGANDQFLRNTIVKMKKRVSEKCRTQNVIATEDTEISRVMGIERKDLTFTPW